MDAEEDAERGRDAEVLRCLRNCTPDARGRGGSLGTQGCLRAVEWKMVRGRYGGQVHDARERARNEGWTLRLEETVGRRIRLRGGSASASPGTVEGDEAEPCVEVGLEGMLDE